MIQEISLFKGNIGFGCADFSFKETRDNTDLIIQMAKAENGTGERAGNDETTIGVDSNVGHEEFDAAIDEAIREIKIRIENAKTLRDNIRDGGKGTKVEEWPNLPYYDVETDDELDEKDLDEILNDRDKDIFSDALQDDTDVANKLVHVWNTPLISENPFRTQSLDDFDSSNERYILLTNEDLIELNKEILQLRRTRKRIMSYSSSALASVSASTTLGMYIYSFREHKGRIYLFLDNIEYESGRAGVKRADMLAYVFIHEMFHAYYCNSEIRKNDPIILRTVTSIEEMMAEFGALCFAKIYNSTVFSVADKSINGCWNSTDSSLYMYGLGGRLYKAAGRFVSCLPSSRTIKSIIDFYQLLQRMFRKSNGDVCLFEKQLLAKNESVCIPLFYKMLNDLFLLKMYPGKHYYFNKKVYGTHNELVKDAMQYFCGNTTHPLPHISTLDLLFDNRNTVLFYRPIFELATAPLNATYYDPARFRVTSGSIDICTLKVWGKDYIMTGNTTNNILAFIDTFNRLKRVGRIDKSITVL